MINLDSITNENNKKHNEKWPYIPGNNWWSWIRKNKRISQFN